MHPQGMKNIKMALKMVAMCSSKTLVSPNGMVLNRTDRKLCNSTLIEQPLQDKERMLFCF
jgi:hypothetical protein